MNLQFKYYKNFFNNYVLTSENELNHNISDSQIVDLIAYNWNKYVVPELPKTFTSVEDMTQWVKKKLLLVRDESDVITIEINEEDLS